jgi:hypothetical protein
VTLSLKVRVTGVHWEILRRSVFRDKRDSESANFKLQSSNIADSSQTSKIEVWPSPFIEVAYYAAPASGFEMKYFRRRMDSRDPVTSLDANPFSMNTPHGYFCREQIFQPLFSITNHYSSAVGTVYFRCTAV